MNQQPSEKATCELCGEAMPPGEEMFKFHGYSGPCPKPPLPPSQSAQEPAILRLVEEAERLLKALPDYGEHWYVEERRPGREDEARVYGHGSWGICKPTTPNPGYRRPIAEFVAASPRIIRGLLAALASPSGHQEQE